MIDEEGKPFYVGKIISSTRNKVSVNFYDSSHIPYGAGAFGACYEKRTKELIIDTIDKNCCVYDFKSLSAKGKLPKKVMEAITNNSSIDWVI